MNIEIPESVVEAALSVYRRKLAHGMNDYEAMHLAQIETIRLVFEEAGMGYKPAPKPTTVKLGHMGCSMQVEHEKLYRIRGQ